MTFEGSYRNPVVLEIPDQVSPVPVESAFFNWGEDAVFRFPALPGVGFEVAMVVQDQDATNPPLFRIIPTVSSGALIFRIPGTLSREKLWPGFYRYSIVKAYPIIRDPISVETVQEGVFATQPTASSLGAPIGLANLRDAADRLIMQHIDLLLPGSCETGTFFGLFLVPSNFDIRITRLEGYCQTAPVSTPLVLDLQIGSTPEGLALTIPAGQQNAAQDIPNGGLLIPRGTAVRGLVVSSAQDDSDPGEFATLRCCYDIV